MSSGKVLLGLLAGIAVGATLGILFAPEKGSSTRIKLSKKSVAYAEELEEKFNDFIESLTEKFESTKEDLLHKAEKGFHKAEGWVENAEEMVKKTK
ncbi:MAG: YtxH domain-containing protein [Saprospiraceae bacterium]|nr:YtxH domain-containing protein [Saprospiraceae bacterium]